MSDFLRQMLQSFRGSGGAGRSWQPANEEVWDPSETVTATQARSRLTEGAFGLPRRDEGESFVIAAPKAERRDEAPSFEPVWMDDFEKGGQPRVAFRHKGTGRTFEQHTIERSDGFPAPLKPADTGDVRTATLAPIVKQPTVERTLLTEDKGALVGPSQEELTGRAWTPADAEVRAHFERKDPRVKDPTAKRRPFHLPIATLGDQDVADVAEPVVLDKERGIRALSEPNVMEVAGRVPTAIAETLAGFAGVENVRTVDKALGSNVLAPGRAAETGTMALARTAKEFWPEVARQGTEALRGWGEGEALDAAHKARLGQPHLVPSEDRRTVAAPQEQAAEDWFTKGLARIPDELAGIGLAAYHMPKGLVDFMTAPGDTADKVQRAGRFTRDFGGEVVGSLLRSFANPALAWERGPIEHASNLLIPLSPVRKAVRGRVGNIDELQRAKRGLDTQVAQVEARRVGLEDALTKADDTLAVASDAAREKLAEANALRPLAHQAKEHDILHQRANRRLTEDAALTKAAGGDEALKAAAQRQTRKGAGEEVGASVERVKTLEEELHGARVAGGEALGPAAAPRIGDVALNEAQILQRTINDMRRKHEELRAGGADDAALTASRHAVHQHQGALERLAKESNDPATLQSALEGFQADTARRAKLIDGQHGAGTAADVIRRAQAGEKPAQIRDAIGVDREQVKRLVRSTQRTATLMGRIEELRASPPVTAAVGEEAQKALRAAKGKETRLTQQLDEGRAHLEQAQSVLKVLENPKVKKAQERLKSAEAALHRHRELDPAKTKHPKLDQPVRAKLTARWNAAEKANRAQIDLARHQLEASDDLLEQLRAVRAEADAALQRAGGRKRTADLVDLATGSATGVFAVPEVARYLYRVAADRPNDAFNRRWWFSEREGRLPLAFKALERHMAGHGRQEMMDMELVVQRMRPDQHPTVRQWFDLENADLFEFDDPVTRPDGTTVYRPKWVEEVRQPDGSVAWKATEAANQKMLDDAAWGDRLNGYVGAMNTYLDNPVREYLRLQGEAMGLGLAQDPAELLFRYFGDARTEPRSVLGRGARAVSDYFDSRLSGQRLMQGYVDMVYDVNQAKLMRALADDGSLAMKADVWERLPDASKSRYVHVPQGSEWGRKLGPLAGHYVDGDVLLELANAVNMREAMRSEWVQWVRRWKQGKTAWSPTTLVRNVWTNVLVFAPMVGMGIGGDLTFPGSNIVSNGRYYAKAMKELTAGKKSADFQWLVRSGALDGNFSRTEVMNTAGRLFGGLAGKPADAWRTMRDATGELTAGGRMWGAAKHIASMPGGLYGAVDDVFRGAFAFKLRERGVRALTGTPFDTADIRRLAGPGGELPDDVIGKLAREAFIDYENVPGWVQVLRAPYSPVQVKRTKTFGGEQAGLGGGRGGGAPFMAAGQPFVSFTARAIPLFERWAKAHPLRAQIYLNLHEWMTRENLAEAGVDPATVEELRQRLPHWERWRYVSGAALDPSMAQPQYPDHPEFGRLAGQPMADPVSGEDVHTFVNAGWLTPFDLFMPKQETFKSSIGGALASVAGGSPLLGPLVNLAFTNYNPFFQRQITTPGAPLGEQALEAAEYLGQQVLPPITPGVGPQARKLQRGWSPGEPGEVSPLGLPYLHDREVGGVLGAVQQADHSSRELALRDVSDFVGVFNDLERKARRDVGARFGEERSDIAVAREVAARTARMMEPHVDKEHALAAGIYRRTRSEVARGALDLIEVYRTSRDPLAKVKALEKLGALASHLRSGAKQLTGEHVERLRRSGAVRRLDVPR